MDWLPSTSYQLPQARGLSNNIIRSGARRHSTRQAPPKDLPMPPQSNEVEDDFPTPRANPQLALKSPSASSSCSSNRRVSTSSAGTDFEDDDIYSESSDDDSAVVPFRISDSVRRVIRNSKGKQGPGCSIIIPSPGMWPTVEKLQGSHSDCYPPPPLPPQTPLSPAALAALASNTLRVPSQSATPSLTGSLTSDEVTSISCPSTPDTRSKSDNDEWDLPVQLHPEAMDTLLSLSADYPSTADYHSDLESISEVQEPEPKAEMQELGLNIRVTIPSKSEESNDEIISAISVPSPGDFFASLRPGTSNIWSVQPPKQEPSTSIAENFYDLPWQNPEDNIVERVIEFDEKYDDDPPTARRVPCSTSGPESSYDASSQCEDGEYDEHYDSKLREAATSNMSRTSVWLSAQESYLSALSSNNPVNDSASPVEQPQTPANKEEAKSPESSDVSPASKKSVRFNEPAISTPSPSIKSAPSDSLFYHAFQHHMDEGKPKNAFTFRESRAEALHNQRTYLSKDHRACLQGQFSLKEPENPQKRMSYLFSGPHDEHSQEQREMVAKTVKEKQALDQTSMESWNLEASRFLNGGLLPQPATELLTSKIEAGYKPRVLDVGGQPTGSWAWAVALEHREAKVYTAIPVSQGNNASWTAHRGPSNHRTVTVPNLWTLPFPSNSFDIISARTLHTLLKNTCQTRDGGDEYDATLSELHRILSPGGILQFSLMDAEVSAPSNSAIAAKGIEFAVSLRTRGYDPCAGRRFVSRMEARNFGEVRRSWLSLPLGPPNSTGTEAVTGLVGSLAWEKWMLKLQMEMGKPEDKLLLGVAKALDEAAKSQEGQTAWKVLVGFARKP